jgi:hypothetical protein
MVGWVKVDKVWKYHIYGFVKTTLIVRDELYRRAKAQAALEGIPLGRLMEESLENRIRKSQARLPLREWLKTLPKIPKDGLDDLKKIIDSPDFRKVDPEMWH